MKNQSLIIIIFLIISCGNEKEYRILEQENTIKNKDIIIAEKENEIYSQKELIRKFEKLSHVTKSNIDAKLACYFDKSKVETTTYPRIEFRERIFKDKAKLYCAPDTNSRVLGTVDIYDYMRFYDFIRYNNKGWFVVHIPSSDGSDIAYIKENAFCNYLMGNSDLNYLGKITQESNRERAFTIKRFNTKLKKVTQVYKMKHYYNGHDIEHIYGSTLSNVSYMMHFSTLYDACPSSFHEEIIVESKGSLITLWSNGYISNEGEGSEIKEESYKVYLPIQLPNRIVLAPYGKFSNILKKNLKHDLFHYNNSIINIPIKDLVVTQQFKTFKDNSKEIETLYHKWTGDSLVIVKREVDVLD